MPPSTIQKNRRLYYIVGLIFFIVGLLVYFAPYGLRHYLVMQEDLKRVNNEITSLKGQNQELRDEIAQLKSDSNYIEQIARKKLGMLKKSELIFEVPEKKEKGKERK